MLILYTHTHIHTHTHTQQTVTLQTTYFVFCNIFYCLFHVFLHILPHFVAQIVTCPISYGLWPHIVGLNEQNKYYIIYRTVYKFHPICYLQDTDCSGYSLLLNVHLHLVLRLIMRSTRCSLILHVALTHKQKPLNFTLI